MKKLIIPFLLSLLLLSTFTPPAHAFSSVQACLSNPACASGLATTAAPPAAGGVSTAAGIAIVGGTAAGGAVGVWLLTPDDARQLHGVGGAAIPYTITATRNDGHVGHSQTFSGPIGPVGWDPGSDSYNSRNFLRAEVYDSSSDSRVVHSVRGTANYDWRRGTGHDRWQNYTITVEPAPGYEELLTPNFAPLDRPADAEVPRDSPLNLPSLFPNQDPSTPVIPIENPSGDPNGEPRVGAPLPWGDPVTDPGGDPGSDPGGDPGSDPGSDPGGDPGADPGGDPNLSGEPSTTTPIDGSVFNQPHFMLHLLTVFSSKFPLDVLGTLPDTSSTSCPTFTFFGYSHEVCLINTVLDALKIPVIISAIIWSLLTL